MATERNRAVPQGFVTAVLPWLLGAGGLLLYLLTLNPWVSLFNLETVAQVSGWSWRPGLVQPLTRAVLYPFHWLPEPWIPLALNLFAALCAGLVLVLLARSAALLPHEPVRGEPGYRPDGVSLLSGLTAWLPPTLAVALCGLQLTFWEQATSCTGEMLDLLIFAFVIWCLLEFRLQPAQSWLSRCAFVYGLGMANNWGMIGYLPVFLVAIIRLKGFGVFSLRFLLRMGLWGLAGLSLYLLLPTLYSLVSETQVGFWTALKANLRFQAAALRAMRTPAFGVLAVAALLPLLALSVCWRSRTVQLANNSRLGVFLTQATGHLVHALCFASSLWLVLDLAFSPRRLGLGTPLLTSYYLFALVAAYCAGHFLRLGSATVRRPAARLAAGMVYVLAAVMPLALVGRNLGQIRATNGPAVRQFASRLYADLPAGKSVVLSDDPRQLLMLQAELGARSHEKDALLLDTTALVSAPYHRFLARQFGTRWPVAPPTNRVETVRPGRLLGLVSRFAAREPVVYLHPSSGLFFERFTSQPHGLVHFLVPRPATNWMSQALDGRLAATNEQTWQQRWTDSLQRLAELTKTRGQPGPARARSLLGRLQGDREQNVTAAFLGAAYSKSLDHWGVQMQRLGRWPEAGVWFERALQLNPGNLSARINLAFNERCQRGEKQRLDGPAVENRWQELFGNYHNWAEILSGNGPLDEPTFLFEAARVLLAGGHNRQAARELARCAELAPEWLEPKLWLALSYIDLRNFAGVLELTERIQNSGQAQGETNLAQLVFCRTTALRGLGHTNEAVASLAGFLDQHRDQRGLLSRVAELYTDNQEYEDALAVLEPLLKEATSDPKLLAQKGFAELQLSRYPAAIATLTSVIALNPSDQEARLCRAMAYVRAGQLDAAREDYQKLLKTAGDSPAALFGLGALAWRRQDTNTAIEMYERFLANATPGSPQYTVASERLKRLQGK